MGDSLKVSFFYKLMKLLKFNGSQQVSLSEEKDTLCVFGGRRL